MNRSKLRTVKLGPGDQSQPFLFWLRLLLIFVTRSRFILKEPARKEGRTELLLFLLRSAENRDPAR